jgi:hypothetical protein
MIDFSRDTVKERKIPSCLDGPMCKDYLNRSIFHSIECPDGRAVRPFNHRVFPVGTRIHTTVRAAVAS